MPKTRGLAGKYSLRNQKRFTEVPQANIQRSRFDRSHGHKTTFKAGNLVPVFWDEILPGDTMQLRTTYLVRMATLDAPIMDNMYMDTFYFFVPNRLIWDKWERFQGEQKNPGDITDFRVPTVDVGTIAEDTIYDYFGLPTQVAFNGDNEDDPIALYFRAYNLIYNEWFRDENLQNSVPVNNDSDGPDGKNDYKILQRGKRKDYFWGSLPWPQKGDAVTLPLGQFAPVVPDGPDGNALPQFNKDKYTGEGSQGGNTSYLRYKTSGNPTDIENYSPVAGDWSSSGSMYWDENTGLQADLASATAATINAIRQAFQLQRLYERDARGGTRYTEIVRSHFGIISPDSRLQRPEYLGGTRVPIMVNAIVSDIAAQSPQGVLGAYGTAAKTERGWMRSFTEHGVVIGLVSVTTDYTYQQGINRHWNRRSRFDYYMPVLAHLGEQSVLSKEIYYDGSSTGEDTDRSVWGYQERYAEYRFKPSQVTAKFRDNYPSGGLGVWHLAYNFSSRPGLNQVEEDAEDRVNGVILVDSDITDQFIMDAHFNYKCTRPMPVYSVPGYVDHF